MTERQDSDREVLTSLPRSRPVRRSAKRGDRAEAKTGAAGAKPRRAAAAKATTKTAAKATAKTAAKATAKRTRKAASKTASRAATRPAPKAAGDSAEPTRTAPTRKIPPAGYATPTARAGDTRASGGADLVSTTIQAAAELAQIGLTVGRQTLQSMLDRLPKP